MFPKKETFIFAAKIDRMNDYKFSVVFLEEAKAFLDGLDEKARDKILYNIWKARSSNDKVLFKKLQDEIWEFRTKCNKTYYRLFAFWDKISKNETVVISTHGLIKKTGRLSGSEIERAEKIRKQYINDKTSKK